MSKIGKKEQLILNRIARKRIALVNENTTKEEKQEVLQLMEEKKNITAGNPPKFSSPEQLSTLIMEYIQEQTNNKKPCTLGGLALRLGMSVETIRNYEKKDKYFEIIRYYRDTILVGMEERLFTDPKLFNSVRYYLNNNFSHIYRDKIEIDNKHSGSISLVELSRLASNLDEGDIIEGELLEEDTLQEEISSP